MTRRKSPGRVLLLSPKTDRLLPRATVEIALYIFSDNTDNVMYMAKTEQKKGKIELDVDVIERVKRMQRYGETYSDTLRRVLPRGG